MVKRYRRKRRKGTVLVLSAVLIVVLFAMLAFAVDLGYLLVTRAQMQRSADAAAMAAAWELVDASAPAGTTNWTQAGVNARTIAAQYAALNPVLRRSPLLADEDVKVGYLADPSDPNCQIQYDDTNRPNAVQVRVRRTAAQNGVVPFFFARALGIDHAETQTEATAALSYNVSGFRTPLDGSNLSMLPFALDLDTWNGLLAGNGTDNWRWDAALQQVIPGADGILEVNLFPQGTGSPGNRGTVDIGGSNNSTADIARQILDGLTPDDLDHIGGTLELDENGELDLNGDTGISAGVENELETIKGEPRIIPVFSEVIGPGNNAQFTIVQFVGIRIMNVNLRGENSSKQVMVQPANIVTRGGIQGPTMAPSASSYYVYSPVWLVR